jgi:hypothetical protein
MPVITYRSDDASAPVLSGQAGALVGILDACLVNGYGSKAAAGFAKEFSGTNKAVYRAATGNRLRLRVDDTTTTYARILGYETMTDVDTGTELFPTTAQISGGLYMLKSTTADATARPWILIADDKAFVLITGCAQTAIGNSAASDGVMQFGDGKSYKASDAYCTTIIGHNSSSSNTQFICQMRSDASGFSVSTAHYVARAYTQIGTSYNFGKSEACWVRNSNLMGTDVYKPAYPYPVTGGILLSPMLIGEAGAGTSMLIRGQIAGLWVPQHDLTATNHLDTFSGVGDLAGTTFIILKGYNGGSTGRFVVQTNGAWR